MTDKTVLAFSKSAPAIVRLHENDIPTIQYMLIDRAALDRVLLRGAKGKLTHFGLQAGVTTPADVAGALQNQELSRVADLFTFLQHEADNVGAGQVISAFWRGNLPFKYTMPQLDDDTVQVTAFWSNQEKSRLAQGIQRLIFAEAPLTQTKAPAVLALQYGAKELEKMPYIRIAPYTRDGLEKEYFSADEENAMLDIAFYDRDGDEPVFKTSLSPRLTYKLIVNPSDDQTHVLLHLVRTDGSTAPIIGNDKAPVFASPAVRLATGQEHAFTASGEELDSPVQTIALLNTPVSMLEEVEAMFPEKVINRMAMTARRQLVHQALWNDLHGMLRDAPVPVVAPAAPSALPGGQVVSLDTFRKK